MSDFTKMIRVTITRQENAEYFSCEVGDTVDVDFEEYVAAVTASELASGGLEASKAQAVAARTFAVARGVLQGTPISDSSAKAQAYRAARADMKKYPVACQAAKDTKGEILTYNGKPANAVYCASNGGRTVSSEELWGGVRPYLIAQDDPWDAAATSGKSGHGVGMSQLGARWAGNHGFGYRQILGFYYPGCVITENYGEVSGVSYPNEKATKIVMLAKSMVGCPYVFGAIGESCTPSNRGRRQSAAHPTVKSKCQVLTKKRSTCEGCQYEGRQMFDCRGLTYWVLNQVGINISKVGATTQWRTTKDWYVQGKIDEMPEAPCILFQQSGTKMSHTGIYIGNGKVVEASVGVQETNFDKRWTHYAIPDGLYSAEEYARIRRSRPMAILRKGSSGELVKWLQECLEKMGYDCGGVDGKYGNKTVAAVKQFQKACAIPADGVAGPITLNEVANMIGKIEPEPAPSDEEEVPAEEEIIAIWKLIDERLTSIEKRLDKAGL